MPAKNLDDMLGNQPKKPALNRGRGMRLSTESQQNESAQPHTNAPAQTPDQPQRVSRGYTIRLDLIKSLKQIALDENRNLYELIEEAIEQYIERHPNRTP